MIDGGFPVYILDDNSILYEVSSKTHPEFWEATVAQVVSDKFHVSKSAIANLPYCQRRGRVVGSTFYCGEKIGKKLFNKISKAVGIRFTLRFDEHETRCPLELAEFRGLIS